MTNTVPTPTGNDTEAITNPSGDPIDINNLHLNHPKNYLAVPLAVATEGDTAELIDKYAVSLPNRAIKGAKELGLITNNEELTELGETVIINAITEHGSIENTLIEFKSLQRSPKRFVNEYPEWSSITKRLVSKYDATTQIVKFLREQGPLQLDQLTRLLWKQKPQLAKSVFLKEGEEDPSLKNLSETSRYDSAATFQYKSMLYHSGVVSSRGQDTSRLNPTTDTWELD